MLTSRWGQQPSTRWTKITIDKNLGEIPKFYHNSFAVFSTGVGFVHPLAGVAGEASVQNGKKKWLGNHLKCLKMKKKGKCWPTFAFDGVLEARKARICSIPKEKPSKTPGHIAKSGNKWLNVKFYQNCQYQSKIQCMLKNFLGEKFAVVLSSAFLSRGIQH